jgi:hypothetical protein
MNPGRSRVRVVAVRFVMLALGGSFGCATSAPPVPAAAPPAPAAPASGGFAVEKMREELQVAPWELAFSGVRGEGGMQETVTVRNLVDHPVELRAIQVVGDGARLFALLDVPALPVVIPAKRTMSVGLAFRPPAETEAGVQRAALRFQMGKDLEDGPAVDLSALVLASNTADAEPPLRQIVDALGFAIDVEAGALVRAASVSGGGAAAKSPIVFTRARPSPVAINPVARFSVDGAMPFGYRVVTTRPGTAATADFRPVGVLADGQHQTLNPELDAGGQTSFDPGDEPFGIWIRTANSAVDTAALRPDGLGARVFALRSRGGAAIANAYLLAFGDGSREDLQDCVFVLWNVRLSGS